MLPRDYVETFKSSLVNRLEALADVQCFYPDKWLEYCKSNRYVLNGILIELSENLFLLPKAPASLTTDLRTLLLKES